MVFYTKTGKMIVRTDYLPDFKKHRDGIREHLLRHCQAGQSEQEQEEPVKKITG